jgi:hypothetical protein
VAGCIIPFSPKEFEQMIQLHHKYFERANCFAREKICEDGSMFF